MSSPYRTSPFVVLALSSALAGCGSDPGVAGPPRDAAVDVGQTIGTDAAMIHELTGVPCDVAQVLGTHCTVCHTQPPTGGAPLALLTRDDLIFELAPGDPTSTIGALALEDMQRGIMPPPPSTPVPAADIQIFADWVAAGMPAGPATCPGTSPYDGPTTCTSGSRWTDGDDGSELMHPGGACLTCHATVSNPPDPQPTMGGTVYPSAHEPDDCNGVFGDATDPIVVTVRDHDGNTISATANGAGNFLSYDPIALPIEWATVTYQGRTRAMASPQPSADCNTCHTERGTLGAPGRILLP